MNVVEYGLYGQPNRQESAQTDETGVRHTARETSMFAQKKESDKC
jgi:hypothetical protein